MGRRSNRKHSKIDGLAPELKATVEQMLLSDATYAEIVDFLEDNGVSISIASVCRYAQDYDANIQALAIAQENFRAMMGELERYPDLDTTEAIIRLTSQNMFNALVNTTEEDWKGIKVDKMMKEATGLIRAAAYKKRVEVQNQDTTEAGLDAVELTGIDMENGTTLVFQAMAKERPDLYAEVTKFLAAKKAEGLE